MNNNKNKIFHVTGPADDPRKVVVLSLAMEIDGRDDVVLDVSNPGNFIEIMIINFNLIFFYCSHI